MKLSSPLCIALFSLQSACPDNGSPAANASPDGGADDADSGVGTTTDGSADDGAAGARVERKLTVVFAMPDLPPQYLCLGGLQPDANGAPTDQLVVARGPFGVFDPSDPTHATLAGGFPYGAIVVVPGRVRDAPLFDRLAPAAFFVDDIDPKRFQGFGVDSQPCKSAYATAKTVPWRVGALDRGELAVGQSWMTALTGCQNTSSDPQCAGGNNARLVTKMLDVAPPVSFNGAGEAKLGIQFVDLSPFPGYQDIDGYVQPLRSVTSDGGAPPVDDGAPILIGGGSNGLAWGDITAQSAGVALPAMDTASSALVIVPRGQSPCSGDAGCATPRLTLPIDPFMSRYAAPSGGATGAAWSGNQVFALFGRVPLGTQETASSVVRLGVFAAGVE